MISWIDISLKEERRRHYVIYDFIIQVSYSLFWYHFDMKYMIKIFSREIYKTCNCLLSLYIIKHKHLVYILLSIAFKWICLFCIIPCSHNKIFVFWSSKISYVETRDKWTTEHRVRRPTSIWYSVSRSFHQSCKPFPFRDNITQYFSRIDSFSQCCNFFCDLQLYGIITYNVSIASHNGI